MNDTASGLVNPKTEWARFLEISSAQFSSQIVYRGVPNAAYELQPSIGRVRKYSSLREERILAHFRRRAELHIPMSGLSPLDQLVLAQHHGLPTRLLDWTTSPLVAAYFAVFSADKDRHADFAIYSIKTNRDDYLPAAAHDPSEASDVKFYLPKVVSPRIAAQSGLFSIHPDPKSAWSEKRVTKITFSGRARAMFSRRLHYLGINAHKLFPGLDGLATTLRWQLEQGVELWHLV